MATFAQPTAGGRLELVGPMDPTTGWEQQPRRVLDSWSGPCGAPFGSTVERTATVTLPMEVLRKPGFEMSNLELQLYAVPTTCEGTSFPDARLDLTFWVDEPYVVAPPAPSLGSTG